MIVPSVAGVGRRRLLTALLALSLLVTAAARAGDAEAHGRVPSPPHAVVHGASADAARVAPTATEAFAASFPSFELAGGDIARAVCGLLAKPVKTGVAGLIGVLSKRVVVGTLAGALFAEIGFNPWCRGRYGALRRRLRAVAHAKPQLRPRIGPFVFNVAARYIGQDARFD